MTIYVVVLLTLLRLYKGRQYKALNDASGDKDIMEMIFATFILLLALPIIICLFCTVVCLICGIIGVEDTPNTGMNEYGKAWTVNQFFGIKIW